MTTRQQLLEKIQAQYERDENVPPVVGLDEYFCGNTDEECIAPNQVGYGRPSLADLYARFKKIQARHDVQEVLVGIHGDWTLALVHAESWPAAENVHIYTTASAEEVEAWTSELESSGASEGWPYGEHPDAPKLKSGYQVITVYWN
jgi:hypothetical protein